MENKEVLFKPIELYNQTLKSQYHTAAEQYFEMLTKNAKTDKPKNAIDVASYKKTLEKLEKANKKLRGKKSLKGFLIFLIILFFIVAMGLIALGIYFVASKQPQLWFLILIGALVACIAVGFIFLITKKLNKEISDQKGIVDQLIAERDKALATCYEDMATLNASFDWNMPAIVMERCTPIIDLDQYFSVARYQYLKDKFSIHLDGDENTSVVGILSGNIQGNPFVLAKTFCCDYHSKRYEGTLEIHWTTTSYDSKGNAYTVNHSETLHAYVNHDAPFYGGETKLIYGNEAAPHLSFSRYPTNVSKMNSKELEKYVAKTIKEIDKKAEKAITNGGQFTRMGNDEFDAIFGGIDRNNEVEFRLLFTPLAQANELALLKSPIPFGDDFSFLKENMINVIRSNHSQYFDYSANPNLFTHYDWTESQKIFVSYCDNFIQGLYFDLAPLISIPLYQMHKSHEYIYGKDYSSYLPGPEHEVMANGMNKFAFIPPSADSSLPLILKTSFVKKNGMSDDVNVHSYSYHTTPMVDYVPVHGGDGYTHNVPVHWIKYDRVDADHIIQVRNIQASQQSFRDSFNSELGSKVSAYHFERGILGMFTGSNSQELDEKISSIFSNKK